MANFSGALSHVKRNVSSLIPERLIVEACHEVGHVWRRRVLCPVATVHLLLLQILHGNTALTHMRRFSTRKFTAAALCQARRRLPLAVLEKLLRSTCDSVKATATFIGHRVLIADATSSGLPDTKGLQKVFPQPDGQRPGCGFPVVKILGLFDAATGLFVEMVLSALYVHEQSRVSNLHPLLKAGDVLLGDRGFCSFWHVAMLSARQVMCVFRMHQKQIVNFRPGRKSSREAGGNGKKGKAGRGRPTSRYVRRLGKYDQIVRWVKPQLRRSWMTRKLFNRLPEWIEVRELRFRIPRKGQRTLCVTIATTLLDPVKYPKAEIARLYKLRWEIETHFKELKTTMNMQVLKCKTADGVKKELLTYALAYNLVRTVMMEAAGRQGVEVDRISFIDTLRWLQTAVPGEELPELVVNPLRPDRHEPRVVKRRPKSHKLLTKPREELRKRLLAQGLAA